MTFSFPAKDGGVIGVEDLRRMSADANFGQKMFLVDFESGDAFAGEGVAQQ